jgi:hypothetical protein
VNRGFCRFYAMPEKEVNNAAEPEAGTYADSMP